MGEHIEDYVHLDLPHEMIVFPICKFLLMDFLGLASGAKIIDTDKNILLRKLLELTNDDFDKNLNGTNDISQGKFDLGTSIRTLGYHRLKV